MKHFAKSISYLTISNIVFVICGYAIHSFLARYLGPAQYGIYGVVIGLMSSINLLLTSGIPTAVSRYVAKDPNESEIIMKKAFKLQIAFSLLIMVFYFLSADFLSIILNDTTLKTYIMLSALIFPSYAFYSLYFGYYNGLREFKNQAWLQSMYAIFKAFGVILLVIAIKLNGAIVGFIIAPFLAAIIISKFSKREDPPKSVQSNPKFDPKLLVKFAIPITVISVFSTLIITVDLFMVKSLLRDNLSTGIYTASSTLAKIPILFLSAINLIILPSITKISKEIDKNKLKKAIKGLLLVSGITVFLSSLMISITAKYLINILYSSQYLPATASLVILAFGIGFYSLFDVASNIISGLGKPHITMYVVLINLPLAILLNYLLIPRYFLNGAATATTIASFSMMIMSLIFVIREYRKTAISTQQNQF